MIEINTSNIDDILSSVKDELTKSGKYNADDAQFLIGVERMLTKRYRGKGRPRNSDYEIIKPQWLRDYIKQ